MTPHPFLHSLILASQSQIRQQLLTQAGIKYEVRKPNIDEGQLKKESLARKLSYDQIALLLAKSKAKQISIQYPKAYVLGCDQVLSCSNRLLNKASDLSSAREQLLFLRGKKHDLISTLAIAKQGEIIWHFTGRATLTVHSFSNHFLDRYLSTLSNQVLKSVGCYQLESLGIQLFSDIKGDYHTILGLPLLPLITFLREQEIILS